eukprot:363891-Chlamydomonas_euryale.AAC.3
MAAAVEAEDKRKLLQLVGLVQFMQHKGSYIAFLRPGALPPDTARGLLGPGPQKFSQGVAPEK